MRRARMALVAVFLVAGSFPCEAQSTLANPMVPLDQPIKMAYRDLGVVSVNGSVSVTLSKDGQEAHAQSHTFDGTTSARAAGSEVLMHFNVSVDSGPSEESTCQIRATGEVLQCDSNMMLPLYDRETYSSGDIVTLPFVTIDGVRRTLDGKIRGTAMVAQRQVLVIDFADRRMEKINVKGASAPMDLTWEVAGYAYLDIETGYPMEMEASMQMAGPPTREFDRISALMKLKYTFPRTTN